MTTRERVIMGLVVVFGGLMVGGCGPMPDMADLNTAIYRDHFNEVKSILAKNPKLINAKQVPAELNPLHNAAQQGRKYMVEFLILKGAKVNAVDGIGRTPLHLASNYGREENVKLLIAKGADVDAIDNRGQTPLHGVGRAIWYKTVGDGRHPANYAGVAELLLSGGADIDAKDKEGRTPLDYARLHNDDEIIALLRKHGAKE